MAENPIRKEDIIDSEGIIKSMLEIVETIKAQLVPAIASITKAVTDEKNAIEKLNPVQKEHQTILAQKVTVINSLEQEQKQNKKTLTETEQLEKRLLTLRKDSAIQNERYRQAIAAQTRDNKQLVASETLHEGSLGKLRIQLENLKRAYAAASPEIANKMIPNINKVTEAVTKAEKAIGVHSRGVGNYKNSILEAGKTLFGFLGIAGMGTAVLSKLKDAFLDTELGASFFQRTTQGIKTFFHNIVSGNLQFAATNALVAAQMAKEGVEIRRGDREDLVKIAQLETEIQLLRLAASKAGLSEAETLDLINKASAKENELIAYKIADKSQELLYVQELLTVNQDNVTLLNEEARLSAEIESMKGENSLRIAREKARLEEKLIEDKQKVLDLEAKEEVAGIKNYERLQKEADEHKKMIEKKKEQEYGFFDIFKKIQKETPEIAKKTGEDLVEANKKVNEDITAEEEKAKQDKLDIEDAKLQAVAEISGASFELIGSLLERSKQRELKAAEGNIIEQERIQKEYANKEKIMAITQAIINGAIGITAAWKNPITAPIMTGVIAAVTALQIGVIASQKFAGGGEIEGKPHSQGGTIIEAEKGEYMINKFSTSKYKGLIEAINKDDKMAIADELRNRNFHLVWGGVHEQLRSAARQDPYTKMMYDLMRQNITTYVDSNGDTNLIYPNGYRRIIKTYKAS